MKAQDLKDFEKEIADIYAAGHIRYPVHLRASVDNQYENNMIKIFEEIKPEDYVFSYWASHAHCLLKGVPRQELKDSIIAGNSIALCFPEHNIYCSGIVGSLLGVAVGTAYALMKQGSKAKVWHFCGDMTANNGNFYEAVKYAWNAVLPIEFVIEDNGISVLSNTEQVWGESGKEVYEYLNMNYIMKLRYFKYKNSYPHSGLKERVKF